MTENNEIKEEKQQVESMESLMAELGDSLLPFKEGDLVEATILAVAGNRIWVDVAGQSLGFIPEREITSKSGLKKGDKVYASVISMDSEEGNVVLSLRQADREKYWLEMSQKYESGEPATITITDANKGGLMSEIGGIQGFLPVSQLSPKNYPRVEGGNKDEILNRLRQFIGTEVLVKVLNCDKEGGKLIFSERAVSADEVKDKLEQINIGDKHKGKITGIVDFGLFVSLDPQVEGLVHISEVSWSRVTDLNKLFKVGDEIEAMIIGKEDGRVSLSIKRLQDDPWAEAAKKYNVGDVISGKVTKVTPFGAFVSIEKGIDGLVHISELSSDHVSDPSKVIELGKEYKMKIISIEPSSHRLGLSLKELNASVAKNEEKLPESKDSESDIKEADSKQELSQEPEKKKSKTVAAKKSSGKDKADKK
ncbi:MAG: 30S ribosomal protein S1 [bacterium ADurb.Bin212]|nr:MAG: 30S ribosomal protein S1 [bacterium ADurb.Bin212]